MQGNSGRTSYTGGSHMQLGKPPTFVPQSLPRSPSVPSLQGDRPFNSLNRSDPMLNRKVFSGETPVPRLDPGSAHSPMGSAAVQASPSTIGGNSNLSVIDLYGDETDSQMASEESEDTNHLDTLMSKSSLMDQPHRDDYNVTSQETSMQTDSQLPQIPKSPRVNISSKDAEHFDRYGFKKQTSCISEAQYDGWWSEYYQYCERRKSKWVVLMEKHGLPSSDDQVTRFPPKNEKLKRYVRKGVPAEWRGNAWWYFANGQELLDENLDQYGQLLQKIALIEKLPDKEDKYPDLEIIERDLNRTFPDNIHFQRESFQDGEPEMIKSLRRVLVAFSLYNPKIGYCQSMNFLAGLLLLFLDEEKSFWMLVLLTSKYLPGVHNVNLEGVNIDQGVLMLCVQEYLPELWDYIVPKEKHSGSSKGNLNKLMNTSFSSSSGHSHQSQGKNDFLLKLPPVTLCTASWFMSCFVGVLPIEVTLRVWDCLFYEGSHFLFKVSLGILKLSEEELLKGKHHNSLTHYSLNGSQNKHKNNNSPEESEMELFQIVQTFPKKLLNPNDIFEKIIFKKRITFNNLDQDEIDRCRKYVTTQRQKHKPMSDPHKSSSHSNVNDNDDVSEDSDNSKPHSSDSSSHRNVHKSKTFNHTHRSEEHLPGATQDTPYGFKRSMTSVNWNSGLKEKVRQIRKKKDKFMD
ncbi:Rab GTPase-activating protein [Maudiozyma humilis]|uniref:Rab GTPase-activating protein n=1 Tax=Maudiozyma humilis TaxID=51915 RepID=A0AAV5S189_MAUHU|nr:Rab GTPase-activating protein [Kazachstania humilis]